MLLIFKLINLTHRWDTDTTTPGQTGLGRMRSGSLSSDTVGLHNEPPHFLEEVFLNLCRRYNQHTISTNRDVVLPFFFSFFFFITHFFQNFFFLLCHLPMYFFFFPSASSHSFFKNLFLLLNLSFFNSSLFLFHYFIHVFFLLFTCSLISWSTFLTSFIQARYIPSFHEWC